MVTDGCRRVITNLEFVQVDDAAVKTTAVLALNGDSVIACLKLSLENFVVHRARRIAMQIIRFRRAIVDLNLYLTEVRFILRIVADARAIEVQRRGGSLCTGKAVGCLIGPCAVKVNVCIVRCRNRNPSVFAGGRRRGCIRRIRRAQGRERNRQEVLKLCIGNAPVISGLFLAAGVPDAQLTVRIIGKAGAINEVLIPLPAARRKNGVGISRP